jgi:hypothetical protein
MAKTFVVNNRVVGKTNANRGHIGTVAQIIREGTKLKYLIRYDNGRIITETNRAIDLHNPPPALPAVNNILEQDDDNNSDRPSSPSTRSTGSPGFTPPSTPNQSVRDPYVLRILFLTLSNHSSYQAIMPLLYALHP